MPSYAAGRLPYAAGHWRRLRMISWRAARLGVLEMDGWWVVDSPARTLRSGRPTARFRDMRAR